MSGKGKADSNSLFVLATRMYVHYKFKTRKSFDPSAALVDDAYAHEVLALVRSVKDSRLDEMARSFEQGRFGELAQPKPAPSKAGRDEPVMDLPLESPSQA